MEDDLKVLKNRARVSAWQKANPDRFKESKRAWRTANPDRVSITRQRAISKWRLAHPEQWAAIVLNASARNRARRRGARLEPVRRATVWHRDHGICYLCGAPADEARWHLEHVVPLALGGEHSYANVKVSHPRCNLRKGARLLGVAA